jgi:hypothetical protein
MKQTLKTPVTEEMKKIKNFCKQLIISSLIIICALISPKSTWAQEIDNARMEQDIEVAEKILEELFNPNQSQHFSNRYKSHGIFLKDYGVIFQVPSVAITVPFAISGQGISYSIAGDAIILDRIRSTHSDDDDDDYPQQSKNRTKAKVYKVRDLDSIMTAKRAKIMDKMKSFYLNYGDLIGQLKDSDKIMLVYDSPDREYTATISGNWGQYIKSIRERDDEEDDEDEEDSPAAIAPTRTESRRTDKIVMEVSRGDISQFKSGKLNKEQFLNKIKVQELEKNVENEMEFDILAGIFEKIVKRESTGYYFHDQVHYQRLANFGVMYDLALQPEHNWFLDGKYHFQFNNRAFDLKDVYILDERKKNKDKYEKELKKVKEKEEREKAELEKEAQERKVELEKFEKEIKENLIQYGRTLRSLKSDEFLALNIKFKAWTEENTIPQNFLFSVKKSVLEAYDKREISLEEAMNKVEVKK